MKRIISLAVCLVAWANIGYGVPVTVNGQFDPGEWNAITPQVGVFSYFYYQWNNQVLYIMNDWWNTDPGYNLPPDAYNEFQFRDGNGVLWEFDVYGDQTIKVKRQGSDFGESGIGITGAYGYHPSLLKPYDHTLYEASIDFPTLGAVWDQTIDVSLWDRVNDGSDGWKFGGTFNAAVPDQSATIGLLGIGLAAVIGVGRMRFFAERA